MNPRIPGEVTMRHSMIVVLFLLSTVASAQDRARRPADSRTVQFTVEIAPTALALDREVFEKQTVLTHVRLAGLSEPVFYTDPPGYPSLPRLARFVALPPGAKVQSVEFKALQTKTIPGVTLVDWALPPQPGQSAGKPNDGQNRYATPPVFPVDEKQRPVFYPPVPIGIDPAVAQLLAYPAQLVTAGTLNPYGRLASVLRVDVSPAQWDISKREIFFATSIQVTVRYSGGGRFGPVRTAADIAMLGDLRAIVVNPAALPFLTPGPARRRDVSYLIVTDDNWWTSDFTRTAGANLVNAFEALAAWKRAKGILASVVRIADIVDGRYGDFRTGAADLQETLRNFLKFAERRVGTGGVVLGGDVDVIPPRMVSVWVRGDHLVELAPAATPERAFWDATNGRVLLNTSQTFTRIFSPKTGASFTEVAVPGVSNPGWRVVADGDCVMPTTPGSLRCIEVLGELADIENTNMALVLPENTIPTDLYFASVRAPEYDVPGVKDWDANGDGLYGTNLYDRSADGVSYVANFPLGRAPVSSAAEAESFVRKVIAYEKYDGVPDGFGGRLLLGSGNWFGGPGTARYATAPPPRGKYYHADGAASALIHSPSAPGPPGEWKLVSWSAPGSWTVFEYARDAAPGAAGFYFCTDLSCATISESVSLGGVTRIPIPTEFVMVFGGPGTLDPLMFFYDHRTQDMSLMEKEVINGIFSDLHPMFGDRRRLYEDIFDIAPAPGLDELSPLNMEAALSRGFNITSLTGHGFFGGCCGVDRGYAATLMNGLAAGVVYADSCSTNEFDRDDAVSEILLTNPTGGAVGYVGNTRYGWVGLGSLYEQAFWTRLGGTRHLGVLHNTKVHYTDAPNQQWTNFSLNLLGDPEMEIWRGEPARLSLSAPLTVLRGRRLSVRVLDTAGAAVQSARVTLIGDGVYQSATTDLFGWATFTPAGRRDQLLTVTATHATLQFVPAQAEVRVVR